MYIYTVPAGVRRSIFCWFFSNWTAPPAAAPAAAPRRNGRRGRLTQEKPKKMGLRTPAGTVYIFSPARTRLRNIRKLDLPLPG